MGKYGPEKTPFFDTFDAVKKSFITNTISSSLLCIKPFSTSVILKIAELLLEE